MGRKKKKRVMCPPINMCRSSSEHKWSCGRCCLNNERGRGTEPPARRVSVIAGERWERKGRLFCLSGNTSSPQNGPEFLLAAAGFNWGSFLLFPSARMGAVRISWKIEALWSGAVGIKVFFVFVNVHEKDLKEYLSHC